VNPPLDARPDIASADDSGMQYRDAIKEMNVGNGTRKLWASVSDLRQIFITISGLLF
jgi:hypothetical protein